MAYDIDTIYPLPKRPLAPLNITILYTSPADQSQGAEERSGTESAQEVKFSIWRAQREADKKIPKPHGQVGCIGRGGYKLESELGWDKTEYKCVQKFVQDRLKDNLHKGHLRAGCPISMQPDYVLRQVQQEVRTRFPILSIYKDDWPSRDMISTYLSNASSMHLRKSA